MGRPLKAAEGDGLVLRERRVRAGLTQARLAAVSKVDQGTISRLERGQWANLAPDTVSRLINTLGPADPDVHRALLRLAGDRDAARQSFRQRQLQVVHEALVASDGHLERAATALGLPSGGLGLLDIMEDHELSVLGYSAAARGLFLFYAPLVSQWLEDGGTAKELEVVFLQAGRRERSVATPRTSKRRRIHDTIRRALPRHEREWTERHGEAASVFAQVLWEVSGLEHASGRAEDAAARFVSQLTDAVAALGHPDDRPGRAPKPRRPRKR